MKFKEISYIPATFEEEQINLIAKVYNLTRVNVLIHLIHGHLTLEELSSRAREMKDIKPEPEVDFFNKLPETFTTKKFLQIAVNDFNFSERTVERKLRTWTKLKLVKKISFGKYLKIEDYGRK